MRFILIFLTITAICFTGHCQSFTIASVDCAFNNLSPQIQPRIDLNGVKCGLIKVRCVLDEVSFKGNVIGDVEHREGEYWVYMSNGSKNLSVYHSKLIPLVIDIEHIFNGYI